MRLSALLFKRAAYEDFQRHNVQSMLPISERRNLSLDERQQVNSGQAQWIPKIFESLSDSPAVRMANPTAQSALWGAGVGLPAAALVASGTDSPLAGMAVGGVAGGLAALLAYHKRRQSNADIMEIMQRLPQDSNLRDFDADPLMAERRRAAMLQNAQRNGVRFNLGV